MSTILVVAEHLDGKLQKASLAVAGFAQQAAAATGGTTIGLVLGGDASVAEALAPYVGRVIHATGAQFANYLAETTAPAVTAVARDVGATVIAAAASTTGKDFLPRVAAQLEKAEVSSGFIADIIDVKAEGGSLVYKRPMWAGNLIARIGSTADVTCVTVRTTNFAAASAGASAAIETRAVVSSSTGNATFVGFEQVKSDRPALGDASVVVSGGRGLKSAEAFGIIEELADLMGGAVGASRAAVDSGYAPNDWQVGQTGKIVAPKLYIAVAISGAIQHLAGMKGSKTIVAINKDPEAPIYQLADYGLVADAFKAVPELTAAVRALKG
jgi:electron transfer flavoprotein alpha subunit